MKPEQEAAELLPCYCHANSYQREHHGTCPAYYRPVVAAALAEKQAEIEELRQMNQVLWESLTPEMRHELNMRENERQCPQNARSPLG